MPPFSKFLLVFGIATICTTILVSLGASIASDASTVSCILISCIASLCTGAALLFCVQKSYQQPLTILHEILSQAAQKRFSLINTDAVPFPELQQDLKTVLADYQYSSSFYTGILTGMPMPYLLVDTEERAISTNKTCLEMLEIDGSVEKSLGKTLADLFYNDPTRKTAVGKAMATGEVFQNLEVTIQGHKGKTQNVLANVFPIYDNNHTCVGGLCLYINMTRLKDAEQLIISKNKQMAEAAVLLEKTASNIVECTTKLSEVIQSSDTYASEATQKLSETANAMEEMNSSVQNVSENAHTASQSSVDTKAKALNGERIVKESLHSIESVRANTDQLKNDMSELNRHTQNITQIMSVISDIADQTNLLALNAAIEAARAGEAGRGFAVVADEVRKLAEKTITSTSDVRSAIEAIQKSTEKSMISMDNAVEQVNNATDQSNKSGEALKEIVLTVEATADQVNSIAQASTEQSSISKVITEAMISADELVRRNAQAIAGATSTVNDLVKQSQSLTELIKNLKS